MPRKIRQPKSAPAPGKLKGWKEIAEFLGEPVSVVQRWAGEAMPLRRKGRFVTTTEGELNSWLGGGKPVHIATEETDLAAELKRGLSFLRQEGVAKGRQGAHRGEKN